MRVNIIAPTGRFNSFYYCATVAGAILRGMGVQYTISQHYMHGFTNYLVNDAFIAVNTPLTSDIAHVDTSLEVHRHNVKRQCRIYTCSENDRKKLEGVGLRVSGVIPRPVNPEFFSRPIKPLRERAFDVYVCGYHRVPDRKNIAFTSRLTENLGLKSVAITNYKFFPFRYDFGSVGDDVKAQLISMSKYCLFLSGCEGFGMPPLEAMALGTPVIFLDAPAHNEFSVGFKVKPSHFFTGVVPGLHSAYEKIYVPSAGDAVEVVKYACGVGDEEYVDLCVKARAKALEIQRKYYMFLEENLCG